MPRPKGLPKTGGRKAAVTNKEKRELTEYAQQFSIEAVDYFVKVLRSNSEDTKNRLYAADLLLNRSHGKPAQTIHLPAPDPSRMVYIEAIQIFRHLDAGQRSTLEEIATELIEGNAAPQAGETSGHTI